MTTGIEEYNEEEQIHAIMNTLNVIMDSLNGLSLKAEAEGQQFKSESLDNVNMYLNTAIEQLETIKNIEH
jgi:hypothetical protein